MLLQSWTVLLGLSSAILAAPAPSSQLKNRQAPPQSQAVPTLPASSLPAPNTLSPATTLKYVTLGLGHQNYTCGSSNDGVALGATAALFDTKSLAQNLPALTHYLPGKLVDITGLPRESVAANALASSDSRANDDKDYRLAVLPNLLGLRAVGFHYFNAEDKLPVFTLPEFKASIVGKRIANIPAPAGAAKGPDGQGAVDWLLLGDSAQGKTFGGLSHVYRVQTAGGSGSGVCAGVAAGSVVRVPYATEYWFYGP